MKRFIALLFLISVITFFYKVSLSQVHANGTGGSCSSSADCPITDSCSAQWVCTTSGGTMTCNWVNECEPSGNAGGGSCSGQLTCYQTAYRGTESWCSTVCASSCDSYDGCANSKNDCTGGGGSCNGGITYTATPPTDTFSVGPGGVCKVTITHTVSWWDEFGGYQNAPKDAYSVPTTPGNSPDGYNGGYDPTKAGYAGPWGSWNAANTGSRGIQIDYVDSSMCLMPDANHPDGADMTYNDQWYYTNNSVQVYNQGVSHGNLGRYTTPNYDISTSGCTINDCVSTDTTAIHDHYICHDTWCSPTGSAIGAWTPTSLSPVYALQYCGDGICNECGKNYTNCPQDCICKASDQISNYDSLSANFYDSSNNYINGMTQNFGDSSIQQDQFVTPNETPNSTSSVTLKWNTSKNSTTTVGIFASVFKRKLNSAGDSLVQNSGWTWDRDLAGSTVYSNSVGNNDDLSSSLNPTYQSLGQRNTQTQNTFTVNNIGDIINAEPGVEFILVWGVNGTGACDQTISPFNQKIVLYRNAQTLGIQAIDRGGQNVNNISANAKYNYFNNLSSPDSPNLNYPQPLYPFPAGQSDYSNGVVNIANQNQPVASQPTGPGGGINNVSNPITLYAYYKSVDGVNFMDDAKLAFVYNNGAGNNKIHALIDGELQVPGACASPPIKTTIDSSSTGCFTVSPVSYATPNGSDGSNGDGSKLTIDGKIVGRYYDYNPVSSNLTPSADILLVEWRVRFDYNSSISKNVVNKENNGFGDGDFSILNAIGNSQFVVNQDYPSNSVLVSATLNGTPYSLWQLNNTSSANFTLTAGSGPVPVSPITFGEVGNWITILTPPSASVSIQPYNPKDAKHVGVNWTSQSAPQADSSYSGRYDFPLADMNLRFAQKSWNPQEGSTFSNPGQTSKWNGTDGYNICGAEDASAQDSNYMNMFNPSITECSDPTLTSIANDTAVGTTDPNGPIQSAKEYRFRLLLADEVGNYAVAYDQDNILAPWAQVVNGDIYSESGFNMYLPNPPGRDLSTEYLSENNVCNSGNASVGSGVNNGSCNNFVSGNNNQVYDPAHNINVPDKSLLKYNFQYFTNLCSQVLGGGNGAVSGCQNSAQVEWNVLPTDNTQFNTSGWNYVNGDLYVNFSPGNPPVKVQGAQYTGNEVILVTGNLYISPDLLYKSPNDGYIFIVKGNIEVMGPVSGVSQEAPTDYVDGMFITDGIFKTDVQKNL